MESSNENNGDPSGEVENIASETTPPFPSDQNTFSLRDIYDKYEKLSRDHASLEHRFSIQNPVQFCDFGSSQKARFG